MSVSNIVRRCSELRIVEKQRPIPYCSEGYVNLLLKGARRDVRIPDIPDHRCAELSTLFSPLCPSCSPQGAGTCMSDINVGNRDVGNGNVGNTVRR